MHIKYAHCTLCCYNLTGNVYRHADRLMNRPKTTCPTLSYPDPQSDINVLQINLKRRVMLYLAIRMVYNQDLPGK